MRSSLLFLALALQLCFHTVAFGQTKSVSNAYLAQQFDHYRNSDPRLNHHNFFEQMADRMQLGAASEMVLAEVVEGKHGHVHYKYRQQLDGLPIFGNTYVLHEKNGVVLSGGGRYSTRAGQQPAWPSMNVASALTLAKQAMKAIRYADEQAQPQLCYVDPAFPKTSERLRLAYQVDLQSEVPFDKRRYFVDARTGQVLCQFPLILLEGVPSMGKTKYYGTRSIVTDSLGPQQFRLHDPTRGGGITVAKLDGTVFTNSSSYWDLTNDQQDEVALDAHYCTQEYFDMMQSDFDWTGLDGNGKALKAQVHNNGVGEVNAFWDGDGTNYGDGNCNYGPLTTMEIVGHEFTHGMIQHTSNLVYSGESGAINESLADMFGKLLEHDADPANFDWELGHSIFLSPAAEPFRVMDDPVSVDMPDYYGGTLWFDFSDVHINSSIGNLWFTMLVDGRQGVNEGGYAYNVPSIGIKKVGQIVFLVNRAYFTESSSYSSFYDYSLAAATELFGDSSPEQLAVQEAWQAVGLPLPFVPLMDLGLSNGFVALEGCGIGEYHPVQFEVINTGNQTYNPSMGVEVVLTDNDEELPPFTYPINVPLAPGERLEVEIPDWFIVTAPGIYFINLSLGFLDENFDNNFGGLAYDIVEHQSSDLEMYVTMRIGECFSPTAEAVFGIYNESCEALPPGTTVNIRAESPSGATIWTMPHTFEEGFEGFGYLSLTEGLALGSVNDVRFILDFAADPDPTNNVSEATVPGNPVIDGDYLNNFNNVTALNNGIVANYFSSNALLGYQGETFFGSTGFDSDPEAFEHCPNFEDNFDPEFFNGVNATIRTCVDFSAFDESSLAFDLALFKNNYATAEGYPYSSMFQAKWTGNETGSAVVFDQAEGEVVHHELSLPANFKGELLLKLYTEIGQWEASSANFATDDFVLLDNLQLLTNHTATDETMPEQSISLSPNPATGSIRIQSTGAMRSLALHDASGHLLRSAEMGQLTNDTNLDLDGLGAGFYLLSIQFEDGRMAVQKVAKI